jgi:Ran GTPase-activating protein (RanGAP) involved in mRNA processing and transport
LDISSNYKANRNKLLADGIGPLLDCILQPFLQILNLSGTELGDDGLDVIAFSLKKNTNLVHLNLANNGKRHLGGVFIR